MILALEMGSMELLSKQGYGESTVLSSNWERNPHYPRWKEVVPVKRPGEKVELSTTTNGCASNLSLADVNSPQAQNFVTGIERPLIDYGANAGTYYGDSTGFLARKMCQKGQRFLSAAVLYENLVVEMNEGKLSFTCPEPMVAIYPKEGTVYSDHPFAIPQWVNSARRTSALAFRDFLLAPEQQKKALVYGFRPTNLSVSVTSPLDVHHGINPTLGTAILQIPSLDVIQAIQNIWSQLNHRVAVMLLLDTSGSMNYLVNGTAKSIWRSRA